MSVNSLHKIRLEGRCPLPTPRTTDYSVAADSGELAGAGRLGTDGDTSEAQVTSAMFFSCCCCRDHGPSTEKSSIRPTSVDTRNDGGPSPTGASSEAQHARTRTFETHQCWYIVGFVALGAVIMYARV